MMLITISNKLAYFVRLGLLVLGLLLGSQAAMAVTISGTVYGNGTPMPSAAVKLFLASDGSDAGQTNTNVSGFYSLTVADGTYNLLVEPPTSAVGYVNSPVNGIVVAGANVTQNVALVTGASILSGMVKLPDGTPVKGIRVTLKDQTSNAQVGQMTTGIDGVYSFPVAPGSYKYDLYGNAIFEMIFPGSPRMIFVNNLLKDTVVTGTTTKDLTLPFAWISGKTTDSNGVAVGAVELQKFGYVGTSPDGTYYEIHHNNGQTKSDASGNYTMALFDGFSYSITTIPPAGSGLAQTVFNNVAMSGNQTRNFAIQASVVLSGVVKLPDGTPVKGIRVTLKDQTSSAQVGQMTTGTDGVYSFPVAPGSYKYDLYGNAIFEMIFPGSPRMLFVNNLLKDTVVTGTTTKDLTLPFAWISGKTTDSNGVAVGAVELQKFGYVGTTSDGTYYEIHHNNGQTKSDASGNYSMALFDGFSYAITIIPPTNSGFSQSILNNLAVSGPGSLGVVLQKPDSVAPRILSGPFATKIGTTTALIVWQTDELATGSATWTGGSATESGYQTQHAITLTGLTASTPYTITVSATDRAGNGPTTAAVTFTTASLPDTTPPLIISGPTVSALTQNSAVIEWETNEPATTSITGGLTATVAGYVSLHRVELTGLAAQTAYTLSVNSTDVAGNGPTTRSLTFTTLAAMDLSPPVITKGPWAVDVTSNAATIMWETDEPANSGVSYNDGTAYGVLNDDALTRQHSVRMTGLTSSTVYNVTVSSKDALGNGPTLSPVFTLKTLSTGDSEAPEFEDAPQVCNINHQLIHLCFKTDEPASVVVNYGLAANSLTQTEARPQLIQNHSLPINGLAASTTYYLRIVIKDQAGNSRTSSLISATTTGTGSSNPSFVHGPTISYQGHDRVVVEWETNRPCNALVEYGTSNFGLQVSNGKFQTKHKLVIPNLQSGTSYQFRVKVTDVDGNSATGGL